MMFTIMAFIAVAGLGWSAQRTLDKERIGIATFSDEELRQSIVHSRQDLRLIAYGMAAIIVMLGIIADKIH
jgi:hypothetical protein